jgi:hypothetical protein
MKGSVNIQLSPFVSKISWWHMAVGAKWCSLKDLMIDLPKKGVSRLPHVSAPQCTMPEKKSAMHMLKTQAHSDTQKFLIKYTLLVMRIIDTISRNTKSDTLVISPALLVLVYPDANISAFFFLSKPLAEDCILREASSGNSDENSGNPMLLIKEERTSKWGERG